MPKKKDDKDRKRRGGRRLRAEQCVARAMLGQAEALEQLIGEATDIGLYVASEEAQDALRELVDCSGRLVDALDEKIATKHQKHNDRKEVGR